MSASHIHPSRSGTEPASLPPDFAGLLELCPNAVVVFDRNFRILYANARATLVSQFPPDFLGMVYWDLRPDLKDTPTQQRFQAAMERRQPDHFEFFHPVLRLWLDVQIYPHGDGLASFYRNVTDARTAEQARSQTVAQLQQVYHATPDCILIVDRNWAFTFANANAIQLLRLGPLVGENLWQLFPGNRQEPFGSSYRQAMEQRIPAEFEAYYADPFNIWVRVLAKPYADDGVIIFFSDITARKQAEVDRDRAAAALGEVLDVTSDAVLSLNSDYTVTFLNRRAKEMLSPVVGNLLGKNLWASFPGADQPGSPFVENYRRAMVDRVPSHFDAFYPEPLNRWFRIEALPAPDGITIFFRDVTVEREADQALRSSENRYRILTDLSPQFIWMGSPDGRITYANQRFLEFIGPQYTPDTQNWMDAFAPADRERVRRAWGVSVATGQDYEVEARLIRNGDGAHRWFCLRASPVRDDNGNVLHWLGVAIDVHDSRTFAATLHQKQLETERQRAELESIYENTPVGLALFDPVSFRYLRINDELARMIGLPKDQIIGRSVLDIASGVASIGQLFQQVKTGKPVRDYIIEGQLSTRPGDHRTWNVNYFPVYDRSGNLTGITTASLEVTQQKKTEAALVQSEKLAAVGRLASSISHEINNPLEAITNLLFLVATDEHLPQDIKGYVTMAQAELSRVSQIATQTLRFHRQAVRPTSTTAASLVDAVLNLYQGRLSNSGIQVHATYASSDPILCFENDIRQVLNNLIANAIDAMRNGGSLAVRAHNTVDHATGRAGLRITIADTGHGMSAATLGRLFEPFFTTKDLNGTGLGLWISKGIVHRHGGRLTFRSSQRPQHHGTVFSLFLPATPD